MSTATTVPTRPAFVPGWTFADRLRKARQTLGVDQRTFAQQLGCSPGSYAQWEAGNTRPRELVLLAQQIERLTGVDATWVLGVHPSQHAEAAPTQKGEGRLLLPEVDSNHQPAGFQSATQNQPADVVEHQMPIDLPLVDAAVDYSELAGVGFDPAYSVSPIVFLADVRAAAGDLDVYA